MRSKAGDIYCERGETFTIAFDIRGNNNVPYCISNRLDATNRKSYLLLTVASSDNITGENRYIANFWCDASNDVYKHFYSTQPAEAGETDAAKEWALVEKAITALGNPEGVTPANYALYYSIADDGTRTYKQLIDTSESDTVVKPAWADYSFKFIKHFPKAVTEQWVEQRYDYSLKLVSGEIVADATSNDRPIVVDHSYPLIAPHSIYIGSNIRGSINAVDESINYKEA